MIDNRLKAFRFSFILILSIICLAPSAQADFKTGEKAFGRGDYATVLREWEPMANKDMRKPRSTWGACMITGVVFCRISRWRRNGIVDLQIRGMIWPSEDLASSMSAETGCRRTTSRLSGTSWRP